MAAHASPAGLQPRHAIGRSRPADGATCVAGDGAKTHASRRGHRRSTGRDAGPLRGIPRVDDRRDVRVIVRVRTFGQLRFANQHRASRFQPVHHRGVLARHQAAQGTHPAGRRMSGHPAQVFHRDGHAMQRAATQAGGQLLVGAPGGSQGVVRHQVRERVQPWLQMLNAGQQGLREPLRAEQTLAQQLPHFHQASQAEVRLGHVGRVDPIGTRLHICE